MYAYVPDFIEYYLGEKPLLAHVPTYLCGDGEQREAMVRVRLVVRADQIDLGAGGQGHDPVDAPAQDLAPGELDGLPRWRSMLSIRSILSAMRSKLPFLDAVWLFDVQNRNGRRRVGKVQEGDQAYFSFRFLCLNIFVKEHSALCP